MISTTSKNPQKRENLHGTETSIIASSVGCVLQIFIVTDAINKIRNVMLIQNHRQLGIIHVRKNTR